MRRIYTSARTWLSVLALAGVGAALGFACQSTKPDELRQKKTGAQDGTAIDGVTWDDKVGEFLDENCASCHDGGSSSYPPNLTSYVRAKRAAKAILREMEDGTMPPDGKVRKKDIELIRRWIKLKTPRTDDDRDRDRDDDDFDDDDDTGLGDDDGASANLSFSYDGWLKAKLDADCNMCHAPNKDYPDLSTYENVSNRAASVLLEVESKRMPKGLTPWNQTAIDKLKRWIAEGKPRADAAGGAGTGGGALTYDTGIKAWFDRYCVGCHGAGSTPPDLSTKAAVQAAAEASLSSVEAKRMPKFNPLSDQNEINKLRDWIAGGKL